MRCRALPVQGVKTYDLTHRIEPGMPVYPGDPDVSVDAHATHDEDGYRVSSIALGSHAGTHVDAPAHTEPDGPTLGAFDTDRFELRARRVDCRHCGDRTAITRADLPDDPAEETDLLALWTGFDERWGTDRYRDHPYLDAGAARWCARRGLDVAVDCFSVDPTPPAAGDPGADEPEGVPAHHALLGERCLIVENLTDLGRPPDRFDLRAYPLALDVDGAPVRAVAVVDR